MIDQISLLRELNQDIDAEKTWDNVEKILVKCRLYEQTEFIPDEAGTTPSYSSTPPSETYEFHSQTEDVAQKNVDTVRYRENLKRRVRLAVSRLDRVEKELIERRYLEDSYATDIETYMKMNVSERTYYRIKPRAIYKLAASLRLQVMK